MSISNEEYLKANNNGQDTQHGHNGSGRGKRGKKKKKKKRELEAMQLCCYRLKSNALWSVFSSGGVFRRFYEFWNFASIFGLNYQKHIGRRYFGEKNYLKLFLVLI